jgi:hypothetical protein
MPCVGPNVFEVVEFGYDRYVAGTQQVRAYADRARPLPVSGIARNI